MNVLNNGLAKPQPKVDKTASVHLESPPECVEAKEVADYLGIVVCVVNFFVVFLCCEHFMCFLFCGDFHFMLYFEKQLNSFVNCFYFIV